MTDDHAMAAEVASAGLLGPLRRSDPARWARGDRSNMPDSHKNSGWVDDGELAGNDDRGWWLDGSGSKM